MDSVRLRNRHFIRMIARALTMVFRALYSSCRIRVIEGVPLTSPFADSKENRYIYCTWHDGILNSLFCGRVRKCAALTSRHADGEYVAEMMLATGIQPVRGSEGRGGTAAARQLLAAAEDMHVVVTTDGPRGPRRKIKPGIIFLASQTGCPIVPVACSGSLAWKPKGRWTDLLVPLPFSTAYVLGGTLMWVPPDVRRDQLAAYCQELQVRMDQLQELADQLAAGKITLEDVKKFHEEKQHAHAAAA